MFGRDLETVRRRRGIFHRNSAMHTNVGSTYTALWVSLTVDWSWSTNTSHRRPFVPPSHVASAPVSQSSIAAAWCSGLLSWGFRSHLCSRAIATGRRICLSALDRLWSCQSSRWSPRWAPAELSLEVLTLYHIGLIFGAAWPTTSSHTWRRCTVWVYRCRAGYSACFVFLRMRVALARALRRSILRRISWSTSRGSALSWTHGSTRICCRCRCRSDFCFSPNSSDIAMTHDY